VIVLPLPEGVEDLLWDDEMEMLASLSSVFNELLVFL